MATPGMKPIPLVPVKQQNKLGARQIGALVVLGAALLFTDTGHAVLGAVKTQLFGAADTKAAEAESAKSDIDASDAMGRPRAEPAPEESQTDTIHAAVPIPSTMTPEAMAKEQAAAAAAAAAASAVAAEKKRKEDERLAEEERARTPVLAPQFLVLKNRPLPGPGASLSEYLQALAATPVVAGQSRPALPWALSTQPVDKPSAYAGLWEGAFNGRVEGEISLYVVADGSFRATVAYDGRRVMYSVEGKISPDGRLSQQTAGMLGGLGLFELQGAFLQEESFGLWTAGSNSVPGSWYLRRFKR